MNETLQNILYEKKPKALSKAIIGTAVHSFIFINFSLMTF